jgi:hypothetical protein
MERLTRIFDGVEGAADGPHFVSLKDDWSDELEMDPRIEHLRCFYMAYSATGGGRALNGIDGIPVREMTAVRQQGLYLRPLPHGQGSLNAIFTLVPTVLWVSIPTLGAACDKARTNLVPTRPDAHRSDPTGCHSVTTPR